MKPAPFGYSRPESVSEALEQLAALGPDAKVLAGGQSLLPLMSMRLATPEHLVDINRLRDLAYVRVAEGRVLVGALTRHTQLLADVAAGSAQPLLGQALRLVAHPTIRNRGTPVGSLVHADPSGELPAVLALLDGAVRVARVGAERIIPATDFFLGPLESAVTPGELAVEASFPVLPSSAGTAFLEVARRHGDYAVCGVAALVRLDDDGAVAQARAAYVSVSPTPLAVELSEAVVGAADFGAAGFGAAGRLAAETVRPHDDIHATAAYRRHLAGVLTVQALDAALAQARSRVRSAA